MLELWRPGKVDDLKSNVYEEAIKSAEQILGKGGRGDSGWTREEMIEECGMTEEEFKETYLDFIPSEYLNVYGHLRSVRPRPTGGRRSFKRIVGAQALSLGSLALSLRTPPGVSQPFITAPWPAFSPTITDSRSPSHAFPPPPPSPPRFERESTRNAIHRDLPFILVRHHSGIFERYSHRPTYSGTRRDTAGEPYILPRCIRLYASPDR